MNITKEQYEKALGIVQESLKSAPPIAIHDHYIESQWEIVEEYEANILKSGWYK